ncbi:hypothetical protein BH24CHL6_BH24CHL6_04100 [soil metagenome]
MISQHTRRIGMWLSLMLTLTTALAACSPAFVGDPASLPPQDTAPPAEARQPGGGAGSDASIGDPDEPIAAPVLPPGPVQPGDGALVVQPQPGIVDARPHAWDHIEVAPDGKTVTIYYWGGVEDCYGLAGVDVQRDADGLLTLTVLEGRRGELAPDTMCIEIALLKSVTITLDEPLLAPSE